MFETVVDFAKPKQDFYIKADPTNFDGLNFLSERNMSEVNRKAMQGTILAPVSYTHLDVYKRQGEFSGPQTDACRNCIEDIRR